MDGNLGYLSAELAATCNALGYYDGNTYHLEPHCKETLRDLIRYLRRDGSSHDIRRHLGNAKLLKTDLLPIIQCHYKELDLFDIALRLVVNLTNPALLVYNEVVPTDVCEHNQYLELVAHLQIYKESFNDHRTWTPFTEHLGTLLNKPVEERDDDIQRSIERILILIRNILHVPASATSDWRPDNDASIHDQVLWALHQSGMLDLLMYMVSSENESHFYLHLLEIICLMIREQPPSLLAQTTALRSEEEKQRDDDELSKLRQIEKQEKLKKQKKYLGIRHSNFGGTYVVKNMKSTSDKDMIYHQRPQDAKYITFDQQKQKQRIPKNKQALKSDNSERRSALSVRLVLKQFCVEMLHAAYNPLMRHVRECIVRGKKQDNDETYYFIALKFFMEFNRFYKFQVKFVSETLAVDTFHFVQKYLETWYEMMTTDKKKLKLWSYRMHLALKAYKELLQNLIVMDRNEDPDVKESSKVIKSNIFYILEYREMLLILAKTYKPQNFSKKYLVDLIETIHIFMKLLCDFCKNKKIVVQKKKANRKAKKKRKSTPQTVDFEEMWSQNENDIAEALRKDINLEVVPFDATLEINMEEQKIEAVKKIHSLLLSGSFEEAIAFFRASRDVWPENDTFGSSNSTPEEELASLKEVFVADLGPAEQHTMLEDIENESAGEEEDIPEMLEQNFETMEFIKRFASPQIIKICTQLLSDFETNTDFTNRCVVKLLHRIAWDCKHPAMLFQASLFIRFQKILRSSNPKCNELAKLATFIVRKFVETAEKNKLVFAEILFLKNLNEAYEIEEGYGSTKTKEKSNVLWEEHEEEELRTLSLEYDSSKPPQPMVDWIMDNLIRKDRSKRAVIKKLKELYLLPDKPSKKQQRWTTELDEELKKLYEEYKDSEDPLTGISERLSEERSRKAITSALLRLGIIQDRKEVHKSKKRTNNERFDPRLMDDSDSDSEDEAPKDTPPKLALAVRNLFQAIPDKKYLAEGLKWLISCLDDTLEDLTDVGDDVPILPLLEDSMLSIEAKEFHDFLWSMNFKKPIHLQEVYWRIPAYWKAEHFNDRKALINFIYYNNESPLADVASEINFMILTISGEAQNVLENFSNNDASIHSDSDDSPRSQKMLTSFHDTSNFERVNRRLYDSSDDEDEKVQSKPGIENHSEDVGVKQKRRLSDSSDRLMDTEDFNEMVSEQCKKAIKTLQESDENQLNERKRVKRSRKISDSSSDERVEDILEKSKPNDGRSITPIRTLHDSDDDQFSEKMSQKRVKRSRKIRDSSSEDERVEDISEKSKPNNGRSITPIRTLQKSDDDEFSDKMSQKRVKRSRKISDSSSEDERVEEKNKKKFSSESEEEMEKIEKENLTPTPKMSSEDKDEDDEEIAPVKKKKRVLIDSDED